MIENYHSGGITIVASETELEFLFTNTVPTKSS